MGLLDGVLGGMGNQPQQSPGLGGTLAAGVVLALLVKGVRQYQASHGGAPGQSRSFDPQGSAGAPSPQGGGLGGLLSSIGGLGGGAGGGAAGGGLGGLLGGLGGAGALGALINHFTEKGFGQQASSWVGGGPNQQIAPHEVGQVLGEDTLNALQQRTGLSRDDLLSELARELPQAISEATPQGRLPASDEELHQIASQPARNA